MIKLFLKRPIKSNKLHHFILKAILKIKGSIDFSCQDLEIVSCSEEAVAGELSINIKEKHQVQAR